VLRNGNSFTTAKTVSEDSTVKLFGARVQVRMQTFLEMFGKSKEMIHPGCAALRRMDHSKNRMPHEVLAAQ
jgi:hypothetical protein